MKQQTNYGSVKQRGIALPIIMIILVLAALVTIYTTTTSVKEQQVTADQYRSEQAFAAAQAGVEHAVKRYNEYTAEYVAGVLQPSGADISSDAGFPIGSYAVMFCDIWDDAGDEAKSAELMKDFLEDIMICKNLIDPTHPKNTSPTDVDGFHNDERVGILSVGKPDDASGRRTISAVSAPGFKVGGGPPGPPLTARGSIGITGNITLINKYANITMWLGEDLDFGSSAVETFINDTTLLRSNSKYDGADGDRLFREDMMDEKIIPATKAPYKSMLASKIDLGQNSDALTGDENLIDLTPDEMFKRVFSVKFVSDVRDMAELAGQFYTDVDDIPTEQTGLIWLQPTATGTISLSKNLGTIDAPAFLVVELQNPSTDIFKITAGGTKVYGMVFVFGNADLKGSPVIYGSMMITEQVAKGAGSGTIVYDPQSLKTGPEGLAGLRGIKPGTWKDWGYVN